MEEKESFEGRVVEVAEGEIPPGVYLESPNGNRILAGALVSGVLAGKRVRVTVEVLPEPREAVGEKMTCGRRIMDMGPWERGKNLDQWERVGRDRVCSFCGSLHPDDFIAMCEEAAKPDGKADVDATTKSYKIYAQWSDTKNASFGGIKFYTHHLRDEDIKNKDELNKLIHKAVAASTIRSKQRMNKILGHLPEEKKDK